MTENISESATSKEIEPRIIKGVAAVILSRDGKILIVQETMDRPQIDKKKGDWSVPGETIEKGETELEALSRGIREEVGKNGDITCSPEKDWIGDYQLGERINGIWARAYLLHFKGSSKDQQSFTADR